MTTTQSQTDFIRALNRVDPTQGLVEYVQATKPYHTKILDVLVEYVYAEEVKVTFSEKWSWEMYLTRPDVDTVYSCGYGIIWDPVLSVTAPDSIVLPVNILGAFDAVETPLPGFEDSNSFLIQPQTFVPFVVAVASTQSNQLVFSKNYDVTGKNIGTNTWEIADPSNTLVTELTTGILPKTFFISSDTGPVGNGKYTVSGTPTHSLGTTYVQVVEAISTQANADGVFHRVLEISEVPQWISGTAVKLSTTSGTLPVPTNNTTTYYFQPTANIGFFNLTTKRYPSQFNDYVDITTLGTGEFFITRDETFVPGTTVIVDNTLYSRNNGKYVVKKIVKEGANERVFVYQKVQSAAGVGGTMVISASGFDEPIYCEPSQSSDLHTDAFIHEDLKFTLEINLSDYMEAAYVENAPRGYGETLFGDAMLGPFGTFAPAFDPYTAQTSGLPGPDAAHTILPTGIDTQLFDLGGIDETLESVRLFYNRSSP